MVYPYISFNQQHMQLLLIVSFPPDNVADKDFIIL